MSGGLPSWVNFNPVSPDTVELLEWWVADGREMSVGRLADRYLGSKGKKAIDSIRGRVLRMHKRGLLEKRHGWDGDMFWPSDHGKKVAERGW